MECSRCDVKPQNEGRNDGGLLVVKIYESHRLAKTLGGIIAALKQRDNQDVITVLSSSQQRGIRLQRCHSGRKIVLLIPAPPSSIIKPNLRLLMWGCVS